MFSEAGWTTFNSSNCHTSLESRCAAVATEAAFLLNHRYAHCRVLGENAMVRLGNRRLRYDSKTPYAGYVDAFEESTLLPRRFRVFYLGSAGATSSQLAWTIGHEELHILKPWLRENTVERQSGYCRR